uniref:Uncharacterized protein n=1 Tax=Anguilla anguilla TaxID=7936 RepID=A0A0E9T3U0_ANGAN
MDDGLETAAVEYLVNFACCSFQILVCHGLQLIWACLQVPVGPYWPESLWGNAKEAGMEVG